MSTEMILARAGGDHRAALRRGFEADELDAERERLGSPGSVPAVKTNRVYLLVGDEFVVPGPRVVDATRKLAQTLHPEAFK